MSVALRAVAVKLLLPFHHVCLAAVFLDQLVNVIGPLASAFRTLDAEHVELVFDVAEDEIGPLRLRIALMAKQHQRTAPKRRSCRERKPSLTVAAVPLPRPVPCKGSDKSNAEEVQPRSRLSARVTGARRAH